MTDFRLQLLLHITMGMKIEPNDLSRLREVDPYDVQAVLAALTSIKARAYVAQRRDWREISERILQTSEAQGIRWLSLYDDDYPCLWHELSERPPVFSYQGEPCWLQRPLISIVGSRTPARATLAWMQRELPEFLRCRPMGVVSGGARGVDQWAHRVAMDSGVPTICVFPTGLLNPYPFGNETFWRRILDTGGCLMSTCGLREPLRKSFFHTRNRWITGLSRVCFVAEANRRSGSTMTARYAKDEHRDICTLPVFPLATQGLANLDLIEGGATMLRDWRDLLIFVDRNYPNVLSPAPPQNTQREEQEDHVDQPQADGGGKQSVLSSVVGADVAHPVGDQQYEADHETATF